MLKELIQNADDSDSTEVHLAWLPGERDAPHPLLRAPAFLALNNGLFRENDAKGIRRIRLGTKAGDLRSIGKFGLGLKSVFHLCESFFYLASANQPGAAGEPLVDLLNPWGDSGFHDDWNEIDQASRRLLQCLSAWPHQLERWFCIWLPLRTRDQLAGKAPIADEYPEAREQLGEDVLVRVAEMLPLARSVKRVLMWSPSPTLFLELASSLSIDLNSTRRRFPEIRAGQRQRLSGTVSAERDAQRLWSLDFHGFEYVDEHESFNELKQRDDWPTRPSIDESGQATLQREKAEPHGAVVLTKRPDGVSRGRLSVSHAVFLPLAEALEEVSCGSRAIYQLLLHGYFFLDAGRIHIDRTNDWNALLLQRAVMPLVLPALDAYLDGVSSSQDEAESLTRALSQTQLFESERRGLCAEWNWILSLAPDSEAWKLVPASEAFFALPRPPRNSPSLSQDVFPGLRTLTSSRRITYDEAPRLAASDPSPWLSGGVQAFESLLGGNGSEVLATAAHFEYLVRFLELEKQRTRPDDWSRLTRTLVGLGRRTLASQKVATLFEQETLFRRFVAILPEGSWLPLNTLSQVLKSATGRDALAPLMGHELDRLLVPSDLAPTGSGGQLEAANAHGTLSVLERVLGSLGERSQLLPPLSRLALELIDATSGQRIDRRRTLGSLRLVRIHDYRSSTDKLVSWNELEGLRASGLLFAGAFTHASALQEALVDASVSRLVEGADRTSTRVLFEADQVGACDSRACFASLARHPRLSEPEHRQELLKKLLDRPESVPEEEHLRAVRFLLHAQVQHYEDTESTLLSDQGSEEASVWGKLARWALADAQGEWRWVPGSLAQLVSPQQAASLGLEVVGPAAAESLLRTQGVGWVNASRLGDSEREHILRTVTDANIWRELPLHQTVGGDFCSLGENVFLDAGVALPSELSATVKLLRLPSDLALQALYRDRVDRFDEEKLIAAVLEVEDPSRMQKSVLDALESLRNIPNSLSALRSTAWLSTRKGSRAPNEVIDIRGAERALEGILDSSVHESRTVSVESVSVAAREHPAFRLLRRSLFLHGQAACEALGDALTQDPNFRLGPLPLSALEGGGVESLVQAFEGVPIHVLPGAALVGLVRGTMDDPEGPRSLAKKLIGDVGIDRLKACLRGLAEKHATANRAERHEVLKVHDWYLRALVSHPEAGPWCLGGLSLLNRKETWCNVEELCLGAHGIDPAHVLSERHASMLEGFVISVARTNADADTAASHSPEFGTEAGSIVEYLRDFEPYVASEILGGFAAILGDDEEVRETASRYLEPRWSLRHFRQRIDWEIIPVATEAGLVQAIGAGEDVLTAMSEQRFFFRVSPPDSAQTWSVSNLLGHPIQVPMSAEYDDLLVGQFRNAPGHGYRAYEISLRGTDPASVGQRRLPELFRNTASVILDRVYGQAAGNLASLWTELAESEQLDLEVSQRLILDHALFYVRQLGGRDSELFADFGREFDDIRYREAELERFAENLTPRRDVNQRKRALREALSDRLTHEWTVREQEDALEPQTELSSDEVILFALVRRGHDQHLLKVTVVSESAALRAFEVC